MKVAIAGYGAEGQSSYQYFVRKGDDVTIVTTKVSSQYPIPEQAEVIIADDVWSRLGDFDLVIRTPPMRPDSIVTNGKVWSQTNEFFARCPAPIIGVTGSKGKGTTASLIASILRASGQKVYLLGNIGVPPLTVLDEITPDDVVVFELSSFQLWDLEKSPAIAVVLMLEPDHLDVHATMEEYVAAKSNISRHQQAGDTTLYHPTNQYAHTIAETSAGTRLRYAIADDNQAYVENGNFCIDHEIICSVDALQLPGAHNLDNACAAISAAYAFLPTHNFIEAGLRSFTGLPHRLKFVREVGGVRYYDDSIATTAGSAMAALKSFTNGKVIILGGSDKGVDYTDVVDACLSEAARVIAIGQTGERIAELCAEKGVTVVRVTGGMKEVVAAASEIAQVGDSVILSPASASFDQYVSYSDRGDQFIAAVELL
jgi:UDP-N-acetylmuramoylalanine--D-glutamate ligase